MSQVSQVLVEILCISLACCSMCVQVRSKGLSTVWVPVVELRLVGQCLFPWSHLTNPPQSVIIPLRLVYKIYLQC